MALKSRRAQAWRDARTIRGVALAGKGDQEPKWLLLCSLGWKQTPSHGSLVTSGTISISEYKGMCPGHPKCLGAVGAFGSDKSWIPLETFALQRFELWTPWMKVYGKPWGLPAPIPSQLWLGGGQGLPSPLCLHPLPAEEQLPKSLLCPIFGVAFTRFLCISWWQFGLWQFIVLQGCLLCLYLMGLVVQQ